MWVHAGCDPAAGSTSLAAFAVLAVLGAVLFAAACARSPSSSAAASATASAGPAVLGWSAPPPLASSGVPLAEAPSWLGVPVDRSIGLTRTATFRHQLHAKFELSVGVPEGWSTRGLDNGMSEDTQALAVLAPDKSAFVTLIVYDPGVWADKLVNDEVARWTPWATAKGWDAPSAIGIGPRKIPGTLVRSDGTLGGKLAELWQVRRRFPSVTDGKNALVVAGAVQKGASAARRAEFFACLASFAPTPP